MPVVADGTVLWLACDRCRIDFRVRAHGRLDTTIVTCPRCGRANSGPSANPAALDAHVAAHEEGN